MHINKIFCPDDDQTSSKTCQKLCDETYFVHVHLFILLSLNILLILRYGTCFVTVLLRLTTLACFTSVMS